MSELEYSTGSAFADALLMDRSVSFTVQNFIADNLRRDPVDVGHDLDLLRRAFKDIEAARVRGSWAYIKARRGR